MKLLLLLLIVSVFAWERTKPFERFDGWTDAQFRNYFGVPVQYRYSDPTPSLTAPDSFDGRDTWPGCDWEIKDQGQCGSCWAFGLSEAAADRWCIANGQKNIIFSAQDPVSCDHNDYGCSGGYMDRSNYYLRDTGVVEWHCFPYHSGGGSVPPCPSKCEDGSAWTKHKPTSVRHVTGVSGIMEALSSDGPCDIAFRVYNDFFSYNTGVYVWDGTSPFRGGHAVKMLGYGHDSGSGLDYWICANSWGKGWAGLGGYFWIKKGSNECAIESEVWCSYW
jgi:cathepsin B